MKCSQYKLLKIYVDMMVGFKLFSGGNLFKWNLLWEIMKLNCRVAVGVTNKMIIANVIK